MKLKITIEDKAYEVEVEVAEEAPKNVRYVATGGLATSAPVLEHSANSATNQSASNEAKACRSPLAGVVSEISVELGQHVEPDQAVLVLEAMKMFTSITPPVAGKVAVIHVTKGDAVKQGQLLMEFE